MKVKVTPLRFETADANEYEAQLNAMQNLFGNEVEFLDTVMVGDRVPDEAQAVCFPIIVGEAYKKLAAVKAVKKPIVIITSEFGTMAMWDWEIFTFFKDAGIEVYAPYNPELARVIFRAIALKEEMKGSKVIVWQDNPGEGMQPEIFKRFYWWEKECRDRIKEKFGLEVLVKSYKELCDGAKLISDERALAESKKHDFNNVGMSDKVVAGAFKLYIAIKREIEKEGNVIGVGTNCLNESRFTDSVPCLAWNLLYNEDGIMWCCEADLMSLVTQIIIDKTTRAPLMMSNCYPFLVGLMALKHEKIDRFPDVKRNPDDYALLVHCGYFGFVPSKMAVRHEIKPKVLAIVDEYAHVVDAEIATGPVTLVKIHPNMKSMFVSDAELEGYVQYPGSDCRNGGLLYVGEGHRIVTGFYSQHVITCVGRLRPKLEYVLKIFGIDMDIGNKM